VFGDRHVIVTVTVTEETPYLSGFLPRMTAMTLMTVLYELILNRGAPLLRRLSYPCNLPDEPDAEGKESRTYAIFEATSAVGFVGYTRRYERGYTEESGRMDYRKWCSGGAQGRIRSRDREDSGSLRCS
jgi:hypothetical protein